MKCYYCDADTRVVKTREILNGYGITRTRECDGSKTHRFNTRESAPPSHDVRQMAVRRSGDGLLGATLFDPERLYRDISNGLQSRFSEPSVNEIVENTVAALERAESFQELSAEEKAQHPGAAGWIWDHEISEEVERQLQRRDRMAVVLFALSTRGRRDREGREGWADAGQVLAWLASKYPTLPDLILEGADSGEQQRWIHPGAPAPTPTRIIKRNRAGSQRGDRQRAFDYQQFKRSIRLAVVGRFPEDEREHQIELISQWVMWGLAGQETVLSSQLASSVLDCLRRVDDIAYLRWAALVKEIDSVSEFSREARALLRYPSPRLQLTGSLRLGREAAEPARGGAASHAS